jgi:hypothetical protein
LQHPFFLLYIEHVIQVGLNFEWKKQFTMPWRPPRDQILRLPSKLGFPINVKHFNSNLVFKMFNIICLWLYNELIILDWNCTNQQNHQLFIDLKSLKVLNLKFV